MKKFMVLLLGVTVIYSLTACIGEKETAEDQTAEIVNPWVKVESVEAAKEKTGENFGIPAYLPEGYEQKEIGVMDDYLIEIVYQKDSHQLTYRACALAAKQGDISGVYEEYEDTQSITIEDTEVILSGDGHAVALATWETGDYSYSLYTAPGLMQEEVEKIIESIQVDALGEEA